MSEKQDSVQLISLDNFQGDNLVSLEQNSVSLERDRAITQFFKGEQTVAQKVSQSDSPKQVLNMLVQQLAKNYDNLCGIQQMFLNNGQLANSTIIASKKDEVLQRLSNIMKKIFDMDFKNRSIDIDSAQIKILITLLFEKFVAVINTFVDSPDLQILIINSLKQSLKTWDKQFKQRIKNIEK